MEILFITNRGESLSLAFALAHYGHKVKFYNRHQDYDKIGAGIVDLVLSWKPHSKSADIVIIDEYYEDTLDRNFPSSLILRTSAIGIMLSRRYDRAVRILEDKAAIPTIPHITYESPDMAKDLLDDFPEHGVHILNIGKHARNINEYMYYLSRLPSVAPVVVVENYSGDGFMHVTTLDWFAKDRWTQPTMYASNHLMWLPKKSHMWLGAYSRQMEDTLIGLSYDGPLTINYRININTKVAEACRISMSWDWNMVAVQASVLNVDPLKYLLGDYIGSTHHYPAAYWLSYDENSEGFPCSNLDTYIAPSGSSLPVNVYYDGVYKKASANRTTHIQIMRDSIHDNPIGANFKKELKSLKRLSLTQ